MTIGSYNLDSIDYDYVIDGKKVYDPHTGKPVNRVWVYPVKQAVIGATWTDTLYFSTIEKRNAYLAAHDYCNKMPRCKIPPIK